MERNMFAEMHAYIFFFFKPPQNPPSTAASAIYITVYFLPPRFNAPLMPIMSYSAEHFCITNHRVTSRQHRSTKAAAGLPRSSALWTQMSPGGVVRPRRFCLWGPQRAHLIRMSGGILGSLVPRCPGTAGMQNAAGLRISFPSSSFLLPLFLIPPSDTAS